MTIASPTPRHAVILCHPNPDSFNAAVAQRYCDVVRQNGQIAILRDLYRMSFNPVLQSDERPQVGEIALAADVADEINLISAADVFVLIYPIWFGTPPAMLKGYVERVFGAGFDHRAMRERRRHSFMADKHLLSLSSSGNSIQWLEEQGAWMSLRNVFDNYLANAFSMKSTEHIHFADIVGGLKRRWIDEELYRVEEVARQTCALYVGNGAQRQTLTGLNVMAASSDSITA